MSGEDDVGNLFAVPDFFQSSKWLEEEMNEPSTRFFRLDLVDHGKTPLFELPPIVNQNFFALPVLAEENADQRQPTPPKEAQDDIRATQVNVFSDDAPRHEPRDVWLSLTKPPASTPSFKTWDSFDQRKSTGPKPLFITEAGPCAFDAFLRAGGESLTAGPTDSITVDSVTYCRSLLSLSLGRESIFFTWDDTAQEFKPAFRSMRITGHIWTTLDGVLTRCLECGNAYKQLEESVRITYSDNPTPCRVALSSAVDRVLQVAQTIVAGQQPRSLLQLQAIVRRVSLIVIHFRNLVSKVRREKFDEHVLALVFHQAQVDELGDARLAHVMREVLQRVSRPWLDFLEEWIGTKPEVGVPLSKEQVGRQKGFIKVAAESYVDDHGDEVEDLDFHLDQTRMPGFIPADIARSVFEAGRNLRFIRTNHPEHVLARPVEASMGLSALAWQFDWHSIHNLERDALAYENALMDTITSDSSRGPGQQETGVSRYTSQGLYQIQMFSTDEGQLQDRLAESMRMLSQPHTHISGSHTNLDPLELAVQEALSPASTSTQATGGPDFAPHWSLIPVLSLGSIVGVQNRVVGQESLKLLYTVHQVKEHLALQREFHLCKNGIFCSRLSHALFDPDMESAERQAGVARQGGVMGLRLSGRDTWPPASSELRLALMGVLSESFNRPQKATTPRQTGVLPGDLSFGVRELSGDEIEKCLDPDGLEALDFLRLSYKTPPPLMSIITPLILVQYDRIFKLMLRVLRMQYTVNRLFRDVTSKGANLEPGDASMRFCFEARHFVLNLSAYFYDVGIDLPWQDLEARVTQTETLLFHPDGRASSILTPDRLREYHSRVLDRIMSALLLRKRQQPLMELLEEIFRVILRFTKQNRLRAQGSAQGSSAATPAELYKKFNKGVGVFLTVCKAMVEKHAARNPRGRDDGVADEPEGMRDAVSDENPLAQLLLRLDMYNYYART